MVSARIATSTVLIIDEDLHVHHFILSEDEPNTAIITRMGGLSVEKHSTTYGLTKVIYSLAMRKPAVGKGIVLKASDTEAQTLVPQHVYKIRKDDMLTKLLFDSSTPLSENGRLYTYLVKGVQNNHEGYTEVWCFYHATSGTAASIWLFFALGISASVGLAVGGGVGDGKFGLSVGTGVLAVLTGIQGAIILRIMY